jgi:TolA-binding protein
MMGLRTTTPLLFGLVFVAPLGFAQDGVADGDTAQVEKQEGTSDDRSSYRDIIQRYSGRLDEFRGEVQKIVDTAEQDERDKLLEGFSATEDQLSKKAERRRSLAIGRFEGFRKKYPNAEYTPHVLYRLAELYFEKEKDEFLEELKVYLRLDRLFADNPDPEMEKPVSPEMDYKLPIDLYEEIVERFPNYEFVDGALYMLGFCYSEANTRQLDEAKAVAAFQRLVTEYPDSPATVDASLRLGRRYFEGRQLVKAIESFRRVVSAGADDPQYDDGLYMLAWSHYRLGEREPAMKYFTMLLDWDRETFLESGDSSNYPKEAVAYMAITFLEVGMDLDGHPLETARNWFGKIGPREWEKDVYQALSEKLEEYGRPRWALQTLLEIQKRWPLDADNPTRQKHVAWLYKNKLPEDGPPARARALADLADTYGEGTPWWEANRSNTDALASARQYIQESLSEVAQELHRGATEKMELEGKTAAVKMAYSEAADRYLNYLESDPFVSDQEENQWYLADTLFQAGRYQEAIASYTSLTQKEGHPYIDGSRYIIVKAWEQILINAYLKHTIKPTDAVRERVVVAPDGSERPVFGLVDAHQSYINAADDIRSANFEDSPGNAVYVASLESERVALHYAPAQILMNYGRFEEGRPRLEELLERFPRSHMAPETAILLVNSYKGDLEKERDLYARFSEEDLGSDPAAIAEGQAKFRKALEVTINSLAERLFKEGKFVQSANAFLAFTQEFPDSVLVRDALYNAAFYFEKGGKTARANELYEDLINRYPDHEAAEAIMFDIAQTSAGILNFDKALDYYGRILRDFGDGENAEMALYNLATLKIGMGDHSGAASALEDFARRFPADKQLEGTLWLAGQQWELEGDRQALKFYQRYLKERRGVDPGHTLESLNWIASHYQETGNRKAGKAWVDLVETCNVFLAEGKDPGFRGKHLAAQVVLKELLEDLEAFKIFQYPDPTKNSFVTAFQELRDSKKKGLEGIEERAIQIYETYSDPDATMGAFYIIGVARLALYELLYNAPVWTKLFERSERQAGNVQTQLRESAKPLELDALTSLGKVLEYSKTIKQSSEWVDKSVVMLNSLRPREYPLEKPEVRGVGDSIFVPVAGPRSEPLPEEEVEE